MNLSFTTSNFLFGCHNHSFYDYRLPDAVNDVKNGSFVPRVARSDRGKPKKPNHKATINTLNGH